MNKKVMATRRYAGFLLAALAASGVFCVCAQDPVPVEPTERIELFNGKDLTNWYKFIKGRGRNCDPKGVFSVVDGKIRITGEEFGCITTEKAYKNYRLTVEYRWTGDEYGEQIGKSPDSGILYHSVGADGGFGGIWMRSIEYNVIKSRTGDLLLVESKKNRDAGTSPFAASGMVDPQGRWQPDSDSGKQETKLVHLKGRGRINNRYRPETPPGGFTHKTPEVYPEKKEGEWNRCELVCDGDTVEHIFNGVTVVRACNIRPTGGRIQLQSEGHGVEYRRVTIEPLSRETGPGIFCDVVYDKPDCTPIVFGAWSRAEGVKCEDYCMKADIWYGNKPIMFGKSAEFRQGTHGWEKATAAFVPKKPVKRIRIKYICGKGKGKAFFRDGFLERRRGTGEVFSVSVANRTMRPFAEENVISADVLDGSRLIPICFTMPDGGVNSKPSPVASGKVEVWTADSMLRISPYAFPATVKSGRSIALELAKGEAESAQILVSTADDVEWKAGSLSIGELRNAAGVAFRGNVKWERQAYLARSPGYIKHPLGPDPSETWFPDPLLPAAPFRVRKGSTQGLWVTFTAARDAAPGVYSGKIDVLEGGKAAGSVPVSIRVRDFELPKTFGLETAFTLMDGFLRARYPENWREMKRKAIDVMLDHRLNPDDITRTSLPEIEDLEHARSRGMNRFNILNIVPEPKKGSKAKWTLTAKPEEIFNESFYSKFTARLRPYVAELRKRDLMRYAYVYGFDERKSEYYEGIEKFWRRLKTDFPDLPVMTTAKQYADMQMGNTNLPSLVSCDWYCPCTYRWTEPINKMLRSKGMKVWWYTCCGPRFPYANMSSYEYPLIEGRLILGAMTYHFGADGFLFWHVNKWNEATQPTFDCVDTYYPDWCTKNTYIIPTPGDGTFLYPAKDRVLPSIRFAQIRDGVEDYEWMKMVEAKYGRTAADGRVKKLVPELTKFSRDPAALRKMRNALGNMIEKRK